MVFADINTSFLVKIFKVSSGKRPKLKPVTSPAAPVVKIIESPIAVRRVSKFSKPAQARFNVTRKKRRLSTLAKSSAKQITATSLPPKVQWVYSVRISVGQVDAQDRLVRM